MAKDKINPKWTRLANKLARAERNLDDAVAKHERAMKDAMKRIDAANASLREAIADARTMVDEVANVPPGEYPAITDTTKR